MKAKYRVLYVEQCRSEDGSTCTEVRLEKWAGPRGLARYILEWGTRDVWDTPSTWLKSEAVVLDGGSGAAHIRYAIDKFDELTGGGNDKVYA